MSRTLTSNSDSWCASVSRRLSVAYNRRVESRKFCHDFCSAMSSPGISLAVRPAIRAAITSCYATHRLWNSPNVRLVALRACTPSSPNPPINSLGSKCPMSPPSQGEVLVKVSAAGVNRADLLQAAGLYPPPPGASELLGMEVSGVVEVGRRQRRGWAPGQEVCALLAGGGYAEYVVPFPPASYCRHPVGLDLQDSAGVPEVACTVWSNLVMTAHLSEGQLLLMHGGAQRRGKPRHSGRPRTGRPGRRHRGLGGQAGILPRTRRRDLDQLPRRGLRRAGARGDRRCGRRRDLRHHGRLVPGPQHRRAGR